MCKYAAIQCTPDMEHLILRSLQERDHREQRFSQLFDSPSLDSKPTGEELSKEQRALQTSLHNLKQLVKQKEGHIAELKDRIAVKGQDNERINDELISLNIENNLLQDRLVTLQEEYDNLVERWLLKAQKEADAMNSSLK